MGCADDFRPYDPHQGCKKVEADLLKQLATEQRKARMWERQCRDWADQCTRISADLMAAWLRHRRALRWAWTNRREWRSAEALVATWAEHTTAVTAERKRADDVVAAARFWRATQTTKGVGYQSIEHAHRLLAVAVDKYNDAEISKDVDRP